MYNLSMKAHEGPSSQRRPTQAHKERKRFKRRVWRRLGHRPIGMFLLIMNFFLKFTTYSRRHTKTERKPMRAHSSQRRPTQAHEEGKRPKQRQTRRLGWHR